MSLIALRCCELRAAATLLCLLSVGLLSAGVAHAAEPINSPSRAHDAQWLSSTSGLKGRLVWLRDLTVKGFFPKQDTVNTGQLDWDDGTHIQFDVERQLFKPVNPDTYGDTLKKLVRQQLGFQIGPNTQFQWDFQRYWTVDDRQEIAVKLGLHFDFR